MLGGAFAPIHNGHLQLARAAIAALSLDRVLMLPTAHPPHRAAPRWSLAQRARWVALAIADDPRLVLDTREARRPGPSYTVDTVLEISAEYPDAQRFLILGADAFADFHRWHCWQQIAELCRIAVGSRPGSPHPRDTEAGRLLPECPPDAADCHGWTWFDAGTPPISSTELRRRLECSEDLDGLVPRAVLEDMRRQTGSAPRQDG